MLDNVKPIPTIDPNTPVGTKISAPVRQTMTPSSISPPLSPLKKDPPPLIPTQRKPPAQKIGGQKIGDLTLREVGSLALAMGISRQAAHSLCQSLRVPLLYIRNNMFFNESALVRILYYLTKAGGPGFAAPGSLYKEKHRDIRDAGKPYAPAIAVSDQMISEAASGALLTEMSLESGKHKPSLSQLTSLISAISPTVPTTTKRKPK